MASTTSSRSRPSVMPTSLRGVGQFRKLSLKFGGKLPVRNKRKSAKRINGADCPALLAKCPRQLRNVSSPGPTTQSCTNGDFPVQCESPRIGGDLCTHFISAICRLDCRDRFEVFVSALENCVSRRRELALVETRFECWVSATESQASHAALTIRVASR